MKVKVYELHDGDDVQVGAYDWDGRSVGVSGDTGLLNFLLSQPVRDGSGRTLTFAESPKEFLGSLHRQYRTAYLRCGKLEGGDIAQSEDDGGHGPAVGKPIPPKEQSVRKDNSHQGQPCKPGWTQAATGCVPASGGSQQAATSSGGGRLGDKYGLDPPGMYSSADAYVGSAEFVATARDLPFGPDVKEALAREWRGTQASVPESKPAAAWRPPDYTPPSVPESKPEATKPKLEVPTADVEKVERVIHTPQFKAWFGDWEADPRHASKAVDAAGKPALEHHMQMRARTAGRRGGPPVAPKPVFTGTSGGKFDVFDKGHISDDVKFGSGFYFTESPQVAHAYATHSHRADEVDIGKKPAVMQCFLNARNPLDLDSPVPPDLLKDIETELAPMIDEMMSQRYYSAGGYYPEGGGSQVPFADLIHNSSYSKDNPVYARTAFMSLSSRREEVLGGQLFFAARDKLGGDGVKVVTRWLQQRGYDSTVREDDWAPGVGKVATGGPKRPRTWIIFEPNQIKSLDNEGGFNPNDPNINKGGPRDILKDRRVVK